jgi:hypothetical protein
MPYVLGLVYSLIPFPALITREKLAKVRKRLLSIIGGVVLLLRAIYRSYRALSGLLALLRALPSLILTRKGLSFLPRALYSPVEPSQALFSPGKPPQLFCKPVELPSSSIRPS